MGNETEDGMTPKSHIRAHSPKISGVPGPASYLTFLKAIINPNRLYYNRIQVVRYHS